jgi:hypothetical protein
MSLNRAETCLSLALNSGENPHLANSRSENLQHGYSVEVRFLYGTVRRDISGCRPAYILRSLDAGQITLHVQYADNSPTYYKKRKLLFFLVP